MTAPHLRPAALAALLLALAMALGGARAGGAEPAPDFASGRAADPDFDLAFELAPEAGQDFLVAVGSDGGYAFARFAARGGVVLGSSVAGRKSKAAPVETPKPGAGQSTGYVLKFRSSAGRHLALVAGHEELSRVELPELGGPLRLAFAGRGSVRVRGIQKIDRSETVLFSDDFTRQGADLGPWRPVGAAGPWRVNSDPHPDTSASPFALECAAGDAPSMVGAGQDFWDDYRARAAVSVLESPGAAGLAFNLPEDGGGYLLRLVVEGAGSGGAGRAELVRLPAGGAGAGAGGEVLASKPIAGSPRSWYELELASSGGTLRASVDGAELAVLSGRRDLVGGRIGLWSSGAAPARFDDVSVETLDVAPEALRTGGADWALAARRWWLPSPSLPAYFLGDPKARSWARLDQEYIPVEGGYWHRAVLAGDQEIVWKTTDDARFAAGQLVLALAADGQDFASGYRLVADLNPASNGGLVLTIFEKDQRVGGRLVPVAGAGMERLGFSREAGQLVARLGSRTVLTVPDTLRIARGRAGARALGGARIRREQLYTAGASLLDEVFSHAAVEWQAICGDWDVASRWKCSPEFTWMLGRARKQLARLDLKRPVRGDFQLDLHFGVGMAERPGPFYDYPINLSVGLSPDAADPAAGYVFAFGGPDVPSRILRAGKAVAEGGGMVRDVVRMPDVDFIHSHWFGLRVRREGGRLTFWGDGEKLAEFADPQPIANADNFSVWTRGDNGAVLARVRIEAAEPLGARRSPLIAAEPGQRSGGPLAGELARFVNRDGTNGAMLGARPAARPGGQPVLRLTNPRSGGTFAAAYAPPGGIDLAEGGRLDFDWRSSPGARVNLYLVRGGVFHRLALTGPAGRPGGRYNLRYLGSVPGIEAGRAEFQHFSLDLAAALSSDGEAAGSGLRVDEIRIGNYEVEDAELLEGLSGNRAGEWVEIAGWRLSSAPAPALGDGLKLAPHVAGRAAAPMPPRLVEPAPLDGDDFERGLGGWRSFGGIDGAQLVRDDTKPAPGGGRWCLLAENQRCGGTMGAMSGVRALDVKRYPMLSFDYCLERGTCVNLLLFTARGRHEITLSDSHGGADTLGSVPGARTDGQWRHADVDLQEALASRGASVIHGLGLADLGPGTSTTASQYRIDNWTLLPAVDGSRAVRFRWESADGSEIAGSSAVLDRDPGTVPAEAVTAEKPELVQPAGLAPGTWYLHVRCRDRKGRWGPPAHWPIKAVAYNDAKPPEVVSVSPARGEAACPERIEVVFADDGSGLSPHDIEVEIAGHKLRSGEPGVTVRPAEKRLTVELADLDGRLLAPPGDVRCRVRAGDYAGNLMATPFEWTWRLDPSRDAGAPAAPRPVHLPSERLAFLDFEDGQGEFANWRRAACYRVEARGIGDAGAGRWYLTSAARRWQDSNNEIELYPHPFDPDRYNHLAFDYRLKGDAGFKFMLQIANEMHMFGLDAGSWRSRGGEGNLGKIVDDGAWHRVEIDLRGRFRDLLPGSRGGRLPIVQNLLANFARQDGMDFDNFVLGSSRSRGAEFIWGAPASASGIAGYSWLLDDRPDTLPPDNATGTERRAAFGDLAPGRHWFHVRALSGAGRWGQAAHVGFVVDE